MTFLAAVLETADMTWAGAVMRAGQVVVQCGHHHQDVGAAITCAATAADHPSHGGGTLTAADVLGDARRTCAVCGHEVRLEDNGALVHLSLVWDGRRYPDPDHDAVLGEGFGL